MMDKFHVCHRNKDVHMMCPYHMFSISDSHNTPIIYIYTIYAVFSVKQKIRPSIQNNQYALDKKNANGCCALDISSNIPFHCWPSSNTAYISDLSLPLSLLEWPYLLRCLRPTNLSTYLSLFNNILIITV